MRRERSTPRTAAGRRDASGLPRGAAGATPDVDDLIVDAEGDRVRQGVPVPGPDRLVPLGVLGPVVTLGAVPRLGHLHVRDRHGHPPALLHSAGTSYPSRVVLDAHRREATARDLPSVGGLDELVVVVADGSDAVVVAGEQDDGVDVAARRNATIACRDGMVGDAVHRVAASLVRLLHELGDGVDSVPDPDVAVVGVAVVGEARPEQRPVTLVDAGRVPDEDVRHVLAHLPVDLVLRHDV